VENYTENEKKIGFEKNDEAFQDSFAKSQISQDAKEFNYYNEYGGFRTEW
jgi:hypothetical protein